MTAARIAAVSLLVLCTSAAQQRLIMPRVASSASAPVRDTVRILAVMADFPADNDPRTTGDGLFQSSIDSRWTIDAPPHGKEYVRSKIDFLHDYFRTASGGRLTITGTVLDSVVHLSQPMAVYSPSAATQDLRRLADLAGETWRKADSLFPALDFSSYDCFIIVHAGVGRDVDLVSILGSDPAPYDIPSITFDSTAFARAFGVSSFAGFSVNGGSVHIRNSLILPETESRMLPTAGGEALLPLGINGLAAASIGSFLGLPDLFDTNTGRSAIGQFGLMDGAAIFAFNGIFPPLPSAWERIALGWTHPVDIAIPQIGCALPAAGLYAGVDTVYRMTISNDEYFLIENRARDLRQDGQRLRVRHPDGSEETLFFASDSVGWFNSTDVTGVHGWVVGAEDYDWALPGWMDSTAQTDGGGILIWHVDDAVIRAARAVNRINADPARRGIDLEEADGPQDIGESYGMFSAGSGSESGSPFDCWFAGNRSPVYQNRFDHATTPNSDSYTGGRSLLALNNFSARGGRMTFTVAAGSDRLKSIAGFPQRIPGLQDGPIPFDADGGGAAAFVATQTVLGGRGRVWGWRGNGLRFLATGDSSGLCAEVSGQEFFGEAAVYEGTGGENYLAAVAESVYVWRMKDSDADGRFDLLRTVPTTGSKPALLFIDSLLVIQGREDLRLLNVVTNTLTSDANIQSDGQTRPCRVGASAIVVARSDTLQWFDLSGREFVRRVRLPSPIIGISSGSITGTDSTQIVVRTEDGITILSADGLLLASWPVHLGTERGCVPVTVDIDGDGAKEIIVTDSTGMVAAYQWRGVIAEGFPLKLPRGNTSGALGTVAVDRSGNGMPDLLFVDDSGTLQWWENGHRRGALFPTSGIGGGQTRSALFRCGSLSPTIGLATADAEGTVRLFDTSIPYSQSRLTWPMYGFDASRGGRNARQTNAVIEAPASILVRERTYNWPNPVYGSLTQIRFAAGSAASIHVRILDLSGRQVAEFTRLVPANTDTEVAWNVQDIQSGVYLAHIEASAGGKSEMMIVKIAVVK